MGHATRCIPVINALIKANFTPIIASDGEALKLLQKEFPHLKSFQLPSYHISYSKNSKYFKFKLLSILPKVIKAVKEEKKIITEIIQNEQIVGIISDNRFGVRSSKVPSVYITHQINVISGNWTWLTSKIHQKIINKFNECWIPDNDKQFLSGILSKTEKLNIPHKFIGILSRFNAKQVDLKYDLLVVLSGVEPQRDLLEKKLLKELEKYNGKVLFIRGKFKESKNLSLNKNITVKDYLLSKDLEVAMNKSKLVIARSGYSTIMDLAILQKKAFFIPTPHQNEQEYLAQLFHEKQIAPYSNQENFKLDHLIKVKKYEGFNCKKSEIDLNIFNLF